MGANIKGAGTDVIRIKGVEKLHRTEYSIIPDQIEQEPLCSLQQLPVGMSQLQNVIPKHLEATTAKLEEIGCEVQEFDDAVRVRAVGRLHRTHVKTFHIRDIRLICSRRLRLPLHLQREPAS